MDGVRALAKEAERYRITICIENSRSYWDGCDPAASPEEIDLEALNTYLAVLPEDWLQLAKDIDRPQVKLCLDTSHATTTAQRVASLDERVRMLNACLDAGEWICHVHWSGNYLADSRDAMTATCRSMPVPFRLKYTGVSFGWMPLGTWSASSRDPI